MDHTTSLLNAKSEFDSFLFAQVGEDKRGTVVSVLTAFARLDFDPRQQAADLARLPKEKAKTKLAGIIMTLPGMLPSQIEPSTLAARLIPLLPPQHRPAVGPGVRWLGASQPANLRSPRYLISIAIFMALGFAGQFFVASMQSSVESPKAQASATAHPQAPTPSQGDAASTTGLAIGDVMTNGKTPRDIISLRGKDGKDAIIQPMQQSHATAAARPAPTTTSARKPLFGR